MADHIQIGDIAPRIQYAGDGGQTAFAYPFPVFTAADMRVYIDTALQATGYSVGGTGSDNGGVVTFDEAPGEGELVTLVREVTIQRTTDFQESGEFRAKVINDELDKQVAMIQQVSDRVQRSLRLAETDSADTLLLPDKATRAGQFLGFDGDGNPMAVAGDSGGVIVSSFMATILDEADAAAARAALGLVIGTDVLAPDGDGSGLSGLSSADQVARDNTILNAFEIARIDGLSTFAMFNTVVDAFADETGVDLGESVDQTYDASGTFYHNAGPYGADLTSGKSFTASSDDGTNVAAYAFDDNAAQSWQSNFTTSGWLQIDFGSGDAKAIVKYTLENNTASVPANFMPTAWVLQASDTGAFSGEEMALDSQTSVSWSDNETKEYTFANATAYRYYRLVSSANGGGAKTAITEMQMMESGAAADMTLVSEAITAASAPAAARALLDHEYVDAVTLNSDCTMELSRDGGTSWTAGTLVPMVVTGSGRQVLAADFDLSSQPSGMSLKWRFKTLNAKEQRLHKIGVQADVQLTI